MNKCPMFVLYIYSYFPVLTLQALSTAYGQAVWITVEILPGTPVLCDFFTLDRLQVSARVEAENTARGSFSWKLREHGQEGGVLVVLKNSCSVPVYSVLGKWMLRECLFCFSCPCCHICVYFQLSKGWNLPLGPSLGTFFPGGVCTKFSVPSSAAKGKGPIEEGSRGVLRRPKRQRMWPRPGGTSASTAGENQYHRPSR